MYITDDRKELFKAIAAAQGEFTTVEKNAKNPHFNSKFAPLDSIIEMIRPILPKHGLSVMQHCDIPESGSGIIIETVIAHESGQYISSRLQMPVSKNDPQGYGSSITYGRRYALCAALDIVSDEDVDGNQTDQPQQRQQSRQQAPKSSAQGTKQQQASDPLSEAQKSLLESLQTIFHGNEQEMGDALRTYSTFKAKDKENPEKDVERYLTLADLRKPNANEKFQRWVGSALGKLRADSGLPT